MRGGVCEGDASRDNGGDEEEGRGGGPGKGGGGRVPVVRQWCTQDCVRAAEWSTGGF